MDTILIIDDESQELDDLRGILDAGGYRFELASSEAEARRIVQESGSRIRAILLDWVLRDVDGIELMRWLKRHPALADVEVVVQSAEFVPENIRIGLDCGAYYYLTKPFAPIQLRAIVRAAVDTFELKRSLARRIAECEDTMRLLRSGLFCVRTPKEAEVLSVHLGSASGEPQKGVALLELMLNGVEHGNLEITYEEKGTLLREDRFVEEVERRLELPCYRDRRVEVSVERRNDEMEVVIADAGDGFDFERYFEMDESRLFDPNGRGVLLATAALELEYLPPGNKVRVKLPANAEFGDCHHP